MMSTFESAGGSSTSTTIDTGRRGRGKSYVWAKMELTNRPKATACCLFLLGLASTDAWSHSVMSKSALSASIAENPTSLLTDQIDPDDISIGRTHMDIVPVSAPVRSKSRKKKHHNAAMHDPAFLRKRTANLLSVTNQGVDEQMAGRMKVDRKSFHFLIDAWAFSGEVDAVDQAMALLERMEVLANHGDFNVAPDVRSYTKAINAISRSGKVDSGEQAEALFAKMEDLVQTGANPSARPNTFTYTAVIEAHAHAGTPDSAQAAHHWCELMVDSDVENVIPTARAFNGAISAYAKSGEADAGDTAQRIFDRLEALYESGVQEAKPSAFNYNSLIAAWANCANSASGERAAAILSRMETAYLDGHQDCKPTTVSFNAVIDAYAKSGDENAADKAEEILHHMQNLFETEENIDARPNVRSFNSVINAWAKSRKPEAAWKAEDMLDRMEKLYEQGNRDVRPDAHSFCTVINAWARSSHFGKAERAYNIFREMKSAHEDGNAALRPNTVAANAVMNACAYTQGDLQEKSRAVEIAHHVMKELEQSPNGKPDQVTYGTFLKVCACQMSDSSSREQVTEIIFRKCAKDGQVGNLVLQQLKAVASEEAYLALTGKRIYDNIQVSDLPSDWWCNVVEGRWNRRRN